MKMKDNLTPHTTRQMQVSGSSRLSYSFLTALTTFALSSTDEEALLSAAEITLVSLRYFAANIELLFLSTMFGVR